ncbi:MAG: glycosyltransferase family 2 protein [Aquificaceae bacterium]|nr:glycosyltransferase family 2 protein [Aquificaceae bacterium]MDW8237814.1 glycosyltransferase family 2 protein [Aquificaceae bacterium]
MQVSLLLSTYNGEKYLRELLSSLERQSYRNWLLYVRDDGSNDSTIKILEEFEKSHRGRIFLLLDGERLGPCVSFLRLLAKAEGDYFLFVDQDDVWLEDKIKDKLNAAIAFEKTFGHNFPILVHTDLFVSDERLRIIASSFWAYQNINPWHKSLKNLLILNTVTGCATLINKPFKELITELPTKAIMHDWWLALIASAFGHIEPIPKQTILYRQHQNQNTGAKRYGFLYYARKLKGGFKLKKALRDRMAQADEFLKLYSKKLSTEKITEVKGFLELCKEKKFLKGWKALKNGYHSHGLYRNIGLIWTLEIFCGD